jgi:hypothetical protein
MKDRACQKRRTIMASLPMPAWSQHALRRPQVVAAPELPAVPTTLTALEWSIVAMAEKDAISSLREPSRFVSALRSLFGVRRPNRLANDRLEALRRLAVHVWHYRWNVPDSELREFVAAGYSLDHYQLVQSSIAQARFNRAAQNRRFAR